MKIVGVRKVSFEGKNDGKKVEGMSVFLSSPFADSQKGAFGCETLRCFITGKVMNDLLVLYDNQPAELVGLEVEPVYNRYGKVSGFNICDV